MNTDDMPQRASEWLLAISEAPDDQVLQAAFDTWLSSSPENRRDWEEINATYALLGEAPPRHMEHWRDFTGPAQATPDNVIAFETARGRKPSGRRHVFFAACAAVAASVMLWAMPNVVDRFNADYATATAEVREVELSDGTIVDLAPDTFLKVAYADNQRTVELLSGTAYFDVVPNPSLPFVVKTGDVETRVLGTAFEVRRTDDDVRVSVAEGHVSVSATAQRTTAATLTAGERVRVRDGAVIAAANVSPAAVGAWRRGELVANDTPVGELVSELRHYHGGVIYLHGDGLAQQPLTGVYNLRQPLRALEAMAKAQGAHFHTLSPWVAVVAGD